MLAAEEAPTLSATLIEELQMAACDKTTPISDLLRKALLVASRLEVPAIPDWIKKELSGYTAEDEIPPYRQIPGTVKARNPFHGWIPAQFPSDDLQVAVSRRPLLEPLSSIEAIASGEQPRLIFSAEQQLVLQEMFGAQMEFACFLSKVSLVAAVDEVRTRILEWSMELDKAGIRGQGLSFSREEKARAHDISINTGGGSLSIGVVGAVGDGAAIATGAGARAGNLDLDEVRTLVAQLEQHVPHLSLGACDQRDLDKLLIELKSDDGRSLNPGKAQQLLGRVLAVVGKAGDTILTTGIRVFVEQWMRAHGMVP